MDPVGSMLSVPSVIFDFDCPSRLTFSALFFLAVVAADVLVVGVFFHCEVTLVMVVMVVAVLVLELFFFYLPLSSC